MSFLKIRNVHNTYSFVGGSDFKIPLLKLFKISDKFRNQVLVMSL